MSEERNLRVHSDILRHLDGDVRDVCEGDAGWSGVQRAMHSSQVDGIGPEPTIYGVHRPRQFGPPTVFDE